MVERLPVKQWVKGSNPFEGAKLNGMMSHIVTPSLKELVKDRRVYFSHYRQGHLYYHLPDGDHTWQFPVPIDDTGEGVFLAEDKALLFMRYIRQAMKNSELILLN